MASPRNNKANIQKTKPEKDLELIQRIGSGTYGEVYKARLKATGELAAVKIINIEPGDDFDIIQQEICIMQDCKHPNIVQYFGSYLRRDKLWIAMEFCGGGSLQDIYHVTGPLTEPMIACVCTETLKGLHYMHSQNKIHRDIKGANILLTSEGDVKLADFGVGAQITSTLGKRNSFIGTPYWMAPEVAAVERTGGYDQMCDVWAVGITAIELADCQPPLFDLHPMRALYLISKRNYTPPTMKDKSKWSSAMKDFIKLSLTKNPKKRPSADKLLQHPYCQSRQIRLHLRELLDKYDKLKQKKKHRYKEVDSEEGSDKDQASEKEEQKERTVKRIKSKKDKHKKEKLNLPDKNSQPVKRETEPERKVTMRKDLSKSASNGYERESDSDVGTIEAPKKGLPPPPPPKTTPSNDNDSTLKKSAPNAPPPLPPRPRDGEESHVEKNTVEPPPPLPPRAPQPNERANCFSKIFNECPLNISCATNWTHPETKNHHLIFASDEGIYSLNLDDFQNIEMFQIFSRPCKWVYVIKNILVSISGTPSCVYMHNLLSLHGQQNIEQFIPVPKGVAYTAKVPGTANAQKCCVVHNPYNNQMYLFVGRKDAVLLLQWYEPMQKFMIVRDFECKLPPTLSLFEPIVTQGHEYPILCVGAYLLPGGDILIDKLDLENGINWEPKAGCTPIDVKTFSQLHKDTIFIAYDRTVLFTDVDGKKLRTRGRLNEIHFDFDVESAVCLPGSVLTFNKNGIQGKSLADGQVTAQFTDVSRSYKLLGSARIVVIESRVHNEDHSNLYILASS